MGTEDYCERHQSATPCFDCELEEAEFIAIDDIDENPDFYDDFIGE